MISTPIQLYPKKGYAKIRHVVSEIFNSEVLLSEGRSRQFLSFEKLFSHSKPNCYKLVPSCDGHTSLGSRYSLYANLFRPYCLKKEATNLDTSKRNSRNQAKLFELTFGSLTSCMIANSLPLLNRFSYSIEGRVLKF